MQDKVFIFNVEQVKAIFNAGIRRGSEEECAFQHGSSTCGGRFDELINELYDIVNEGKRWGDNGFTDFDVIETWLKEKK